MPFVFDDATNSSPNSWINNKWWAFREMKVPHVSSDSSYFFMLDLDKLSSRKLESSGFSEKKDYLRGINVFERNEFRRKASNEIDACSSIPRGLRNLGSPCSFNMFR